MGGPADNEHHHFVLPDAPSYFHGVRCGESHGRASRDYQHIQMGVVFRF